MSVATPAEEMAARGHSRLAAQRRQQARGVVAVWLLLSSLVAGFGLGALTSDYFRISQVRVYCPNESLRLEVAEKLSDVSFGNIWLPPTRQIEHRVGGLPRARRVSVERELPRTLDVRVQPRVPAAVLEVRERFLLVDEEGVCLNWTGAPGPELLILRIADPSGLGVGDRLESRDAALFTEALSGLRQVKLHAGARLDVSNSQRIEVVTADGVLGKLGDDELLRQKIVLFGKLLRALRAEGRVPLYIDLRVPSRPSYRPLN